MRAITKEELSFQYFPFYVQPYLNDFTVTALSMAAEACYLRLLARQWDAAGCALPVEPPAIRMLTKASPSEWKKVWRELEPLFPIAQDIPGRRNPALWKLRQEREAFIEQKRSAGKAGGRPPRREHKADHEAHENHTGNQNGKHNESTQKPYGFAEDTANGNHEAKQTESLELCVGDIPQSPPPSGGGSFPTAAPPPALAVSTAGETDETVRPGESLPEYRQRMRQLASDQDSLAAIGHEAGQQAVQRFLAEQRVLPDKIASWVRRIIGWTNGLATSGMRAVSWDSVIQGIEDILDTNPPGQSISPMQLLSFVEKAERQRAITGRTAAPGTTRDTAANDRQVLIDYARQGDADAQAECERQNIDWREVA